MKLRLKSLLIFFITLISLLLFGADEGGAPNELVTENPEREVTTVESLKTREHATMSLSVTKVVPEEIMGKLENGKLSIFISKLKKEPRALDKGTGNADGIDISKLRLKAYSNPKNQKPMMLKMDLSAEDIKAMQRDVSEEKKISVVENTDKYVRLEVENVSEDEKIYISVLNGDKVVKSYRIGGITPYALSDYECWGIEGKILNTKVKKDCAEVWGNGKYWVDYLTNLEFAEAKAGIVGIKIGKLPTSGNQIYFKDEFFNSKRIVNITGVSDSRGFRLVSQYGVVKAYIGSAIDDKGNRLQPGIFPNDGHNFRLENVYTFREMGGLKEGDPINCNIDRYSVIPKTLQGKILLGFDFGITIANENSVIPGIYEYNDAISAIVTRYKNSYQTEEVTVTASYVLDIGNTPVQTHAYVGDLTTSLNESFILPTQLENSHSGLSFMFKNSPAQNKGGLWLNDNNNFFSNLTEKNGRYESEEKKVSGNNGGEGKVKIVQKDEEWAQVIFTPTSMDTSKTTTFNFNIWQGRKDNNGNYKNIKKVIYSLEFLKMEEAGNVTFTVDPRLKQIASTVSGNVDWITSGKNFGGWNSQKVNLPGFIAVDSTITRSESVSAESVAEYTKNPSSDGYTTFKNGDTGYNEIAFKNNVQLNTYGNSDNLMVSPAKAGEYHTIFKTTNGEQRYASTISVKYATADKLTSSGYTGTGTLDMSSGTLNNAYTFTSTNLKPTGLTMEVSGTFPNTYGVVTGQTSNSIANGATLTCNNSGYKCEVVSEANDNSLGKWKVKNTSDNTEYLTVELTKTNQLILTKLSSDFDFSNEDKKLTLKYYNNKTGKEITLGTFDLKVKSTRTITDIGTVNVNIDSRLTQVNSAYSWVGLDGEVSNLAGTRIGNYSDFISPEGSFKNFTGEDKIKNVEKINNVSSLQTVQTIYKKATGNNEGAFPFRKDSSQDYITMSEFTNTGNGTKLVISRYNISSTQHNGKNEFVIDGTNGKNQEIAYSGNIQENYKKKNGKVNLPISNPQDTAYTGSGTLNLILGTLNQEYSFQTDKTGSVTSNPSGLAINLANGSESLDASGVVTKTTERVANKMRITVNSGSPETVNLSSDKLEKEILDGKVKIGINEKGELAVTKLKNENIDSTDVKIEYYYDPTNTISSDKAIKLGTFTLTLSNPIVTSSTDITVKIDKRFADSSTDNWLFRNGKVVQDILNENNNGNSGKDYSSLFSFEGNLNNNTGGTITKALGVEGRETRHDGTGNYDSFKVANQNGQKWWDEAAVPKSGSMFDINSLVVVSKGNATSNPLLDNKFSLLFNDGTDKMYKGNLKEAIVGNGVCNGSGIVDLTKATKDTKYTFKTKVSSGTISSDNGLSISGVTNNSVDASGVVGSQIGKNIATILEVSFTTKDGVIKKYGEKNLKNNSLEVAGEGLTVGIDNETGGLTLTKTKDSTDISKVVITYYYDPNSSIQNPGTDSVKLGSFTLNVQDVEFEIEGEGVLNFDKMVYREEDPLETRAQEFKIKNSGNKNINFSVKQDTAEMTLNSGKLAEDSNDKIDLTNISVTKKSNEAFELQATANLTKETKPGIYQGEIEVTVTITDGSK